MTDKRKAKARALAAKSGMSYQAALNALGQVPPATTTSAQDSVVSPESFRRNSLSAWADLVKPLLGTRRHVLWQEPADITDLLSLVARQAPLHHCFLPRGGGVDLAGARLSPSEPECIELQVELGADTLLRPGSLQLLRADGDGRDEFAYFRLECRPLAPSGVYSEPSTYDDEVVIELEPGRYASSDRDDLLDEPSARLIRRQLRGSFLLFAKASPYNLLPGLDAYDEKYAAMPPAEFHRLIQTLVNALRERGLYGTDVRAKV